MNAKTLKAYRAWRRAAEKGYGKTTHVSDMRRIDARIVALKARFESMLKQGKGAA